MKDQQEGIKERSYDFALRIIKLSKSIPLSREGNILAKQVMRSGTSIGANVEEATSAFSKDDFTYKMNTSLKEARETHYWLRLIRDSELLPAKRMTDIIKEIEEVKNILGAIVRTSKKK
ncbi:MAG: four helix bundle protein [Ignavibacteriales bacterium]|nr:four helix bundle protein [Ignavibacteriales bacterium]